MRYMQSIFESRSTPENPETTLSNPAAWLLDLFGGGPTSSGERVSEASALRFADVWSCLRVRGETFAQLPMIVYERLGERERAESRQHQVYDLLKLRPNEAMSSLSWRFAQQVHADSWGNGYARIIRQAGAIVGIEPMLPDRMRVIRRAGSTWYLYNEDPTKVDPIAIPGRDVLHVHGMSFDGVSGYSVIGKHRESIGYGLGVRNYGSRHFANNAKASGLLSIPGKIKNPVADEIAARIQRTHGGENAGRPMVVGQGATWTQIGLPPNDSQFIETQELATQIMARIFRVPLHKIQFLKYAGDRANIEQENLGFLTDTMLPIFRSWEQELDYKLFSPSERARFYVKVNVQALLRGDFKTRMEGYRIGREIGMYSIDDLLAHEEENAIGGKAGKMHTIPMNWQPVERAAEPAPAPAPAPAPGAEPRALPAHQVEQRALGVRRTVQSSNARLIEEAAGRVVRREVEQLQRQVRIRLGKRDARTEELAEYLVEFYEKHRGLVSRTLMPVFLSFAEQIAEVAAAEVSGSAIDLESFVLSYVATLSARYTTGHQAQLMQLLQDLPADELAAGLALRLEEWKERTPAKLGSRESIQAGSAFTKAVWSAAGVLALRWIASSDCALCATLHNKIVSIDRPFVLKGEDVDPGAGTAPMRAHQDHGHPPLHQGCVCAIVPA